MARKRSQQLSLLSHNKSSSGPHTLYLRKTGDFEGLISGEKKQGFWRRLARGMRRRGRGSS